MLYKHWQPAYPVAFIRLSFLFGLTVSALSCWIRKLVRCGMNVDAFSLCAGGRDVGIPSLCRRRRAVWPHKSVNRTTVFLATPASQRPETQNTLVRIVNAPKLPPLHVLHEISLIRRSRKLPTDRIAIRLGLEQRNQVDPRPRFLSSKLTIPHTPSANRPPRPARERGRGRT